MEVPIAYLVRAGSVDNTFPLLSDPGLSESGKKQAEEVRGFFAYSGIGPVKAPLRAALMEFAQLISTGIASNKDLPPVVVDDNEFVRAFVEPGGIIAVFEDKEGYRYAANLHPKPFFREI